MGEIVKGNGRPLCHFQKTHGKVVARYNSQSLEDLRLPNDHFAIPPGDRLVWRRGDVGFLALQAQVKASAAFQANAQLETLFQDSRAHA
jgi:hypothetical protein